MSICRVKKRYAILVLSVAIKIGAPDAERVRRAGTESVVCMKYGSVHQWVVLILREHYKGNSSRDRVMAKTKKLSTEPNDQLITSLIGLAAVFVSCAIWWSIAPQWLTSTWQTF